MFETSFGSVERALIRAFGVRRDDAGPFNGRLIAFQKGGLFGTENMPGKGRPLTYTPDLCHRMIFACELSEAGITPAVMLSLVDKFWERRIRSIFKLAETAAMQKPGAHDIIMYLGSVALMTGTWSNKVLNVHYCRLKDLPEQAVAWMKMREDDPAPAKLPPRVIMTNLSHRLRRFYAGLAGQPVEPSVQRSEGPSRARQ